MNDHIYHNEDTILGGTEAATEAVRNLFRLHVSHIRTESKFSIKYDGIAVFVGVDPTDGKFFVSNKSFLNKTPKLYKSKQEIHQASMKDDLKNRLCALYDAYKDSNLHGNIYQGDLMYIRDDLKLTYMSEFDTEPHVTFQANTLVYATSLHHHILVTKLGVAWHTKYVGADKISQPVFRRYEISGKDAYHFPILLHNIINDSVYLDSMRQIQNNLSALYDRSKELHILNRIAEHDKLVSLIRVFNNQPIRANERIYDYTTRAKTLYNMIRSYFDTGFDEVYKLVHFYDQLMSAKDELLFIVNFDELDLLVYLKTKEGNLVPSQHEGLVQHTNIQSVKLVDRYQFSHANFSDTYMKAWQK